MNELPKNFFKNEAKFMLWMTVGVIVIGIMAALLIPPFAKYRNEVRCEQSGGVFDNKTGKCIEANSD